MARKAIEDRSRLDLGELALPPSRQPGSRRRDQT